MNLTNDVEYSLGGERQMNHKDYSIIYSSNTGNTKLLADVLHAHLPEASCRYFGIPDADCVSGEVVYVGFWTDKGTADEAALSYLKQLNNKKIFLFGTAGFDRDGYFEQILANVEAAIDPSNEVVGRFMCQGKMQMSVRERYLTLKAQGAMPNADAMIANFDKALSHPDTDDLEALKKAVDAL